MEQILNTLPLEGGFLRVSFSGEKHVEILGEVVFNKSRFRKTYAVKLLKGNSDSLVVCSELTTAEGALVGWNCMHNFTYSDGEAVELFIRSLRTFLSEMGDRRKVPVVLSSLVNYCEKETMLSLFSRMLPFVSEPEEKMHAEIVKAQKLSFKSSGVRNELFAKEGNRERRICVLEGNPKRLHFLLHRLTEGKLFFYNTKRLMGKLLSGDFT